MKSNELERKRPRSRPGNFNLIFDSFDHLFSLRTRFPIRSFESLPFLCLFITASAYYWSCYAGRRSTRRLRRRSSYQPPCSYGAPLHHTSATTRHTHTFLLLLFSVAALALVGNNYTVEIIWAGPIIKYTPPIFTTFTHFSFFGELCAMFQTWEEL